MEIDLSNLPNWLWTLANTLIAALALIWTIHTSRKIESQSRPSVVFRDYDNGCHNVMDMMCRFSFQLVNTGNREAINVTIPKEYIAKYPFLSQWEDIRRELSANGGYTTCANGPRLYSTEITELVILYEDTNGKRFSTRFENGKFSFGKGKK